jgi:hypothetical protein
VYPETFGITITISRLSEDKDKKLKIVKKMLGYLGLKQLINIFFNLVFVNSASFRFISLPACPSTGG